MQNCLIHKWSQIIVNIKIPILHFIMVNSSTIMLNKRPHIWKRNTFYFSENIFLVFLLTIKGICNVKISQNIENVKQNWKLSTVLALRIHSSYLSFQIFCGTGDQIEGLIYTRKVFYHWAKVPGSQNVF
jgi:hypothetical protein